MKIVETASVSSELFYSASPKSIARGDEDPTLIFYEPETNLGQVGAFSDAIDSTKSDHVRPSFGSGLQNITDYVQSPLRSQKLDQ